MRMDVKALCPTRAFPQASTATVAAVSKQAEAAILPTAADSLVPETLREEERNSGTVGFHSAAEFLPWALPSTHFPLPLEKNLKNMWSMLTGLIPAGELQFERFPTPSS